MTMPVDPDRAARNRDLLARLNGTTAPSATPPVTVVIHGQSAGQIADVLRDLQRVKVEFQLRAILAHMGVPR